MPKACPLYQAGTCSRRSDCAHGVHPTKACRHEVNRSGSCTLGPNCGFSHNPQHVAAAARLRAHPVAESDLASCASASSAGGRATGGNRNPLQPVAAAPLKKNKNKTTITSEQVCLNFQAGKCSGEICPGGNKHPSKACWDELKQPNSCPRGINCTFSHNPLSLHVQRTAKEVSPPPAPMTPPVTDSDAGSSSAPGSNVCRDFQKGSCPRKNCKFYHPPPPKPCHFEFQKKGSCNKGLQCRFSHQQPGNGSDGQSPSLPRPNLKHVDNTYKLRGNNLFWMKAANKAQQSRKLKGGARKLVTLDELRGQAKEMGVGLIAGSLASDKKPKVPGSKTYAEPNSIRLTGPLEKVKTIETILEEQEAILEGMTKHEGRWLFSDDPWAKLLMETKYNDMKKIFNNAANDGYGWYEFIHNDGKGKGAANKAGKKGAEPKDDPMQVLSLASSKINGIELQVAYAPNIVAAQVDAIIISCGPYMHMEDGVAQDITDWNATSKNLALDAKKKKFGNGPLQASEFVAVSVPSGHQRGSNQNIFCSFLPPATENVLQNSSMIRKSMRNVMQHIAEHNASASTKLKDQIKSLALPLLGTGRYGHSPTTAAKDILAEVMAQLPHSGVKRVLFLDQRVEPLEALKSAVKNLADEVQGSPCKLRELPIKELIEPGWYYYVSRNEGGSSKNFANAQRSSAGMGHVIPDDQGAWFPLFPDVRERVEAAYQRWQCRPGGSEAGSLPARAVPALPTGLPASMQSPASSTVSFNVDNINYPDGIVYEVAFDCSPMMQKNTWTGFERKVMRKERSYVWKKPDEKAIEKILGKSAKKAAASAAQAAASAESTRRGEVIGILYQALDKASAEDACRMAKSEITSKFQVQSFCIPLPDHALSAAEEAEVQSMLSGIPVGLEIITGAESSNIKLTGLAELTEHLDLAKEMIVESPIYVSNSKFTYPSTWNSTQVNQATVVDVDANSGEFHDVAAKFVKDMPTAKVSKVQRVQNDLLYKAYQGNFRILHERYTVNGMKLFKDADLTKELWHGTSGTSPETVALSAFGTEKAYSSEQCMWGAGNYFSTTTSYSNRFAYKVPRTKSRQMVLFEVLTGLVFDSPPDNGLKKPPSLPSDHAVMTKFGSSAPSNLQYDSVTGFTKGTRVYITYSSGVAQQYPQYIVTYEP